MVAESRAIVTNWLHAEEDDDETCMAAALLRATSTVSAQAVDDRNYPIFLLSELVDSVLSAETLDAAQQVAAATLVRYLTYRIERPL